MDVNITFMNGNEVNRNIRVYEEKKNSKSPAVFVLINSNCQRLKLARA